jgi:hypothetical protein
VNFGIEFFRQQEVSISCTEKEVKLVTGSKGQERLTILCSAYGKPFPFMNKGRRVDKENKNYTQKAEKRETEVNHIDTVEEVVERKLWAAEKVTIPAGSAKLVKVRTEGNWTGAGVVELLPLEDQEKGRNILLPENAYNLSGSVQAKYEENHAEECVELCVGQKLGTIHSMCIDKQAWIKEELRGCTAPDLDEEEVCYSQETVNSIQESDFPTEESKRKFIKDSFKIDENEILNRDAKLKEEVIKLFLENFASLALHPNHYSKTDLLELPIELQPGAVPKRSKVRPLNPDQRANLKEQLDEWIQQGIIEPANSPWASPLVPVKKKDGRTRWVTDLKQLNDVTIKDAYPLTNIQENLQKLKGAKIFTSIDACGAYHAIQIEEGSRD